jgi:general stress protein 26
MTDDVEKFWELAAKFDVGMLITQDEGVLRARPLAIYLDRPAQAFHFLTRTSAHKVKETQADDRVCLTLADPSANLYLSVSGHAQTSQDRELIHSIWNTAAAAWFESGPDNPDVSVLTLTPDYAEYWEGTASTLAKAWQLAAGAFGKKPDLSTNAKLTMGSG